MHHAHSPVADLHRESGAETNAGTSVPYGQTETNAVSTLNDVVEEVEIHALNLYYRMKVERCLQIPPDEEVSVLSPDTMARRFLLATLRRRANDEILQSEPVELDDHSDPQNEPAPPLPSDSGMARTSNDAAFKARSSSRCGNHVDEAGTYSTVHCTGNDDAHRYEIRQRARGSIALPSPTPLHGGEDCAKAPEGAEERQVRTTTVVQVRGGRGGAAPVITNGNVRVRWRERGARAGQGPRKSEGERARSLMMEH
jgi:hypothetical protein